MFRPALRSTSRRAVAVTRSPVVASSTRRFISTQPPVEKSRSWKNTAVRLALAGGIVYYYNTSPLFANEPEASIAHLDHALAESDDKFAQTIEKIVEEKRQRAAREELLARQVVEKELAAAEAEATSSVATPESSEAAADIVSVPEGGENGAGVAAALEESEQEAGQQGAFNPETGEINWDCPCLGGMAHGPCGEEFRAAFSCFVYSTEEPKGMECIEKFKGMQDCFRLHPDIYGAELADDDEAPEATPETASPVEPVAAEPTAIPTEAFSAESATAQDVAEENKPKQ